MVAPNNPLLRYENVSPDLREIVAATSEFAPSHWGMMLQSTGEIVRQFDAIVKAGGTESARIACNAASLGTCGVLLMTMIQADLHAGDGKLAEAVLAAIDALQANYDRRIEEAVRRQ